MKAIVIGIFEDFKTVHYEQLNNQLDGILEQFVTKDAKISNYKTMKMMLHASSDHDVICSVGLGKMAEYDLNKHRLLMGALAKNLAYDATVYIDSFIPKDANQFDYVQAASEGSHLAQYQHVNYKKKAEDESPPIKIAFESTQDVEAAVARGKLLACHTNKARELYATPANKLTSTDLADIVAKFAQEHDLEVDILGKQALEKAGMGGILAVNRGSTEEPRLIVAKYMNGTSDEILGLVGKGITFDTGGYSLKTPTSMYGAHGDLGGAATMFGAFCAVVEAQLPVNVILVIPSTDNVVSANATKPGDVIKMLNGVTVEINNTDAEGRLILGDALTYATQIGATRLVNAATLTGAVAQALGGKITGAFTNHSQFMNDFTAASEKAGEQIWELPIFKPEQDALKTSAVADLINTPSGPGALIAAAFLKEFVEDDIPWIHLDIAGTATMHDSDLGPNGASGVMVRTLFNYVDQFLKNM